MDKKNKQSLKLRMVFMGTSDLSETILAKLIKEEFNLVGVFTKPDMKVGRKQEIEKPAVKILAEEHKIEIFQPIKFNAEAIETLKNLKPDIVIVAAYGKILPKAALEIPGFGCINVHVSLLPKYRGPSPVQNAILQGEKETGVTIMLMDQGVDTGDILAQEKMKIDEKDTTGTLMPKLADLGAQLLVKIMPDLIERGLEPVAQNSSEASMCQLIEREDGRVYWNNDAQAIYNQYRALTSWPGIFTNWKNGNEIIRLKLVSISYQKKSPQVKHAEGEVFEIADDIGVQTQEGIIIIKEIQKEGKSVMPVKTFINGYPNFLGSVLY
jgi:methionyl-tRNA formyltransferase